MKRTLLLGLCLIFSALHAFAQEKVTVNGYVKDAANGEDLFGANVLVKEIGDGAVTNFYGFYSITLPPGTYTLEYRYVGYETLVKTVDLKANVRMDVEIRSEQQQLQEVVVSAEREDQNVTSIEMSVAKLDMQTITKVPAFAGEVDVLKTIQLLPGVSTVGEGASGFNVRGGSVGQNLVLLDEAPVFNSSHLLGFFSVFNPDAVKDIKLYKGAIPSRYGGRISSILDIRMKEGNNKSYDVAGGIGTIFSRLAVEGPIQKEKSSFIVAGRRSYADVLAKPFTDVLDDGAQLYFYDLTVKTNFDINEKNRVFASGYFGRDKFLFDARQGFDWGNKTATIRWNHLFNDRLFSNFTAFYSNYDYSLAFGENDIDKFEWTSEISTFNFKPEFSYFINTNNELSFGGDVTVYQFDPANALGVSNGEVSNISLDRKFGMESAVYAGNEQKLSPALTVNYGLRLSSFSYMGPGQYYEYDSPEPGVRKTVTSISEADNLETIQTYFNLEPRASFSLLVDPTSSIKGSYNRTAQYVHLISNTVASNPLDVWTPSTNNIEPQTGQQVSLGYFRNFNDNMIEASVETYYRATKNQIDYIDGADLLINPYLEGDLLSGIGRAYGVELYVQKKKGKLNGWVSYTLGRTELKVDGINNNNWYATRYDQTHNVKVAAFYDVTPRLSFSANFSYITGTPTTFPTDRFEWQDYVVPYNYGNGRNNVRIPDYHRFDLGATLNGKTVKRNGKPRKVTDQFVLSVYNVYNRRNPFSIYFTQGRDRPVAGEPLPTEAIRVAIIGSIFPSITYNFKF
tara:strand:+ start:418 stop:2799 length:2382 start_codon:yes stop_codon:yes gene_type:complete